MIEKMKSLTVVAKASEKDKMLKTIRRFGVMHISEKKASDSTLTQRFEHISKNEYLLKEFESKQNTWILSEEDFTKLDAQVSEAVSQKKLCEEERSRLAVEIEKIKAWDNFEPDDIKELCSQGIEIHIYRMGRKELDALSQDLHIVYVKLAPVDKMQTVAVFGSPLDKSFPAMEFVMPEVGLSKLQLELKEVNDRIDGYDKKLVEASGFILSYEHYLKVLNEEIIYSSVSATAVDDEGITVLSGYIPADNSDDFMKLASENTWAYLLDDVAEDDEKVPTKVRYGKVTGLMKPVFDILGTVPGYREFDISLWFLLFFAIFFAMIIGDAGYGLVFLAVAGALHIKKKKADNLVMLLYVMSGATILWGAVTGTWFGLESAMDVPLLRFFVIKPIANYPEKFGISANVQQNNIMKFSFLLGTAQLTLACVMNYIKNQKQHSWAWVADYGWLLAINGLYYVVLLLVIQADVNLMNVVPFIIAGFVMVVFFGGMSPDKTFGQGLKASLGDAFTTFLNTISAFGNIMSYIRLFAVGMASLAIAQSFNNMAGGMSGALKIVGALIFIIGHALNLIMGLLSVVVHGVRLNLLEFSGQLGMEWSGIAYEPFKENKN